jgi:CshA-type fibril repeat protein
VTVDSLFGSLYSDPNDQPNPNSLTGIAITDLTHDASKGTWQYQPAAGGDWTVLNSSIASSASLTLKATDRLRFVPANDYVGAAPQLTVRLIENVTPTTGGSVNLSGALSPDSNYSSNTSTLNHEVKGGLLVKGLADVSEGTPAIFTVSLDAPMTDTITLSLDNNSNSTQSGDYTSNFNSTTTWDSSKVNVYTLSGSTRVVIAAPSGVVSIESLSKFYVSVPTTSDSIYEGAESFGLSASMTGSSSRDTSTILDNGRGVEYNDDATPKSSYSSDNDLMVDVTAITPVNEASEYAFFRVTGSSGDSLRLAVADVSTSLVAPRIYYAVDSTTSSASWTLYDGNGNTPAVPGAVGSGTGTVYVRVSVVSEQDDTYEGAETFKLTATSVTNSIKSDFDTTTIIDNGTGKKYGPDLTSGSPDESTSNLDDDRALMVTSYAPVNEGSTYHMFKVTGPAGAVLNLDLELPSSGNPATLAGFSVQYILDKSLSAVDSNWTTYTWNGTSGNRPTVPNGGETGEVYVRVNITSEMDDPAEGSEKFVLEATTLAGRSASGTGEILDDGLGGLYTGVWGSTEPTTTTGQLEDDRLRAINDRVSSPVVSTLTINVRSNDLTESGVSISDQIDLDPSTPNVADSQLVVAGQGTWNVVNGNVTYTRLSTFYADPNPITYAIRPTDRANFSKKTATIDVDFPVVTRPDFNTPAVPDSNVTIAVLANDTFGDAPVGAKLRFAGRSAGDQSDLVVPGQGTWSINPTTFAITFDPLPTFRGDPTPQSYVVEDADGNLSNPTLMTVTYQRTSQFVVQINDSFQSNATGFDVVVVDNVRAVGGIYPTIELASGVFVTPNRDDADLTVGRIGWTGAVGRFSRVQVDARSKPLTTGTMADISLVSSVTGSTGGNLEIRASDMSYSLAAGTYTLTSPIAGTNNGTVWFTETVGLQNQPFTPVADPTAVSNTASNSSPGGGLTNRSLSWTGTRQITLDSPTLVSLSKSVKLVHSTSTRTTQTTAGGKLVESSEALDLRPYTDWVLPGVPSSQVAVAPSGEKPELISVDRGINQISNFDFENVPEFQPIFVCGTSGNDEIHSSFLPTDVTIGIESPSGQGLSRPWSRSANSKKM